VPALSARNFVRYWLKEHSSDRLVVVDALTYAGNVASLDAVRAHPALRFVQGDICDTPLIEQLLREERIDTIVHFAAESHVDRSIQAPDVFIETNIVGTHSMLKAARKVWLEQHALDRHRFHHVSTDEVYGSLGPDDPAFHERTPYAPNSPYAASKAASDHLVRAYHHTYGLPVTISNCSNNYGPFHFPEKLIPLAIVNILRGRVLPVYGDGRHVRTGCMSAITVGHRPHLRREAWGRCTTSAAGRKARTSGSCICCARRPMRPFTISPTLGHSIRSARAARGEKAASLIKFVRDRPGHDKRYAIDCTKMRRELGYEARISLAEGLCETFAGTHRMRRGGDASWTETPDGIALPPVGSRRAYGFRRAIALRGVGP